MAKHHQQQSPPSVLDLGVRMGVGYCRYFNCSAESCQRILVEKMTTAVGGKEKSEQLVLQDHLCK